MASRDSSPRPASVASLQRTSSLLQNVPMGDNPTYLGVPVDVLAAIGKLVVAAGRVESAVHDVAHALDIDPSKRQLANLAKEIRERLQSDLPAHARVSANAIRDWLQDVREAFETRNRVLHGVLGLKRAGDEWMLDRRHLKTGTRTSVEAGELDAAAHRLATLAHAGTRLEAGLLIEPRAGVYLRKPRPHQATWVLVHFDEASREFPPRPTEAELDEWWRRYHEHLT
jgi:hypothetical protein